MLKLIHKFYVRILLSIFFGLLPAITLTHIKGPCTIEVPGEDISRCVSFGDAIMQPGELLNNKQDSLLRFSTTFATVSLVSFTLLSIVSYTQKKQS